MTTRRPDDPALGTMGAMDSQHSAATVTSLPRPARGVVGAFLVSGVVHLVRPQVFVSAVPRWLPSPRAIVIISGVAELACAVGMLLPRTRRTAGAASAALLVAVFPANVQMAVDAHHAAADGPTRQDRVRQLVTLARLPLQIPLIRAAWSARR